MSLDAELLLDWFADTDAGVRQALVRLRTSPYLPHRGQVRGVVYDVETHTVREVEAELPAWAQPSAR